MPRKPPYLNQSQGYDGRIRDIGRAKVNRTLADELANKVRVLCWVMTQPAHHESHAAAIKKTWGERCNKLLFMSTQEDTRLPAVRLFVQEGRRYMWGKTKAAFKYVYQNHRSDADWFLKAEDDTYVIVENLRYMLSKYNTCRPMYFGNRMKLQPESQGYMSGGAGYVLSRAALHLFVENGYTNCERDDTGQEDLLMGTCLENLGVRAMDSRDSELRGRFFDGSPHEQVFPDYIQNIWYFDYLYYPARGYLLLKRQQKYIICENFNCLAVTVHEIQVFSTCAPRGPVPLGSSASAKQ